jgi:hypothetical protein
MNWNGRNEAEEEKKVWTEVRRGSRRIIKEEEKKKKREGLWIIKEEERRRKEERDFIARGEERDDYSDGLGIGIMMILCPSPAARPHWRKLLNPWSWPGGTGITI